MDSVVRDLCASFHLSSKQPNKITNYQEPHNDEPHRRFAIPKVHSVYFNCPWAHLVNCSFKPGLCDYKAYAFFSFFFSFNFIFFQVYCLEVRQSYTLHILYTISSTLTGTIHSYCNIIDCISYALPTSL